MEMFLLLAAVVALPLAAFVASRMMRARHRRAEKRRHHRNRYQIGIPREDTPPE
ncbi:hypothetical protein ABC347_11310 [Sphingomonas sp. 1P06PA]|uniref:hypothetical protein n=1 Tax=Sphingomonas sp. 1P06PA TaxID=554121 RepID=UPI0039A56832